MSTPAPEPQQKSCLERAFRFLIRLIFALVLGILIVGIIRLKIWAWWASLVYLSLLSASTIISFSRHSFFEIIQMMNLPSYELEFLSELTLIHDFHLASLITPPLFVGLGLLIYSKRYFGMTET